MKNFEEAQIRVVDIKENDNITTESGIPLPPDEF